MLALRNPALALVAALALLATGCKSNNEGKIVGKWSAPNGAIFEFTADGQFIATGGQTIRGRYSLGAGDTVNLTNLSPPLSGKTRTREKITITGDSMVVAGGPGEPSVTFTRVKQ